eukprot:CAMPEP_0119547376 /NCGR_PEP_ID=MMETSP1352-20130426/1511_1 /TAXON_ID=265584 /ORGANISM="Stauroneis constricta, Strain CCMP1120" /LENGTH=71 /DNA_ID=CAMNT_0007592285 /DNA_START=308 /DNA_END=523 /DNA_ORIENTATION=-
MQHGQSSASEASSGRKKTTAPGGGGSSGTSRARGGGGGHGNPNATQSHQQQIMHSEVNISFPDDFNMKDLS